MIIKKRKNGLIDPFTKEELEALVLKPYTSIASFGDRNEVVYYQGDEPAREESNDEIKTVIPLTDEQLIASFQRLKELGVI